jgi:hypothetical protein
MAKKASKKNHRSEKSKNKRIAKLEKKTKMIEKTMLELTSQLSERGAALLRKVQSKKDS